MNTLSARLTRLEAKRPKRLPAADIPAVHLQVRRRTLATIYLRGERVNPALAAIFEQAFGPQLC